jgi:hypothetical protein
MNDELVVAVDTVLAEQHLVIAECLRKILEADS